MPSVHVAVLVKQVPDTEGVRIDAKTRQPDTSRANLVVSQYDKHAVEAAVKLKEATGGKVTAISLGGPKTEDVLREVLAMGCDAGIAVEAPPNVDGIQKARALAEAIKKADGVNLVMSAEESADSHTASTGAAVAAFLGWPMLGYVVKIEAKDGQLTLEREADEGVETDNVPLPAVLTVGEGIGEPRLPALMQILQAKNKPLQKLKVQELGVKWESRVTVVSNVAPQETRKLQILEGKSPEEAATWLLANLKREGVVP